jgi:Ni/Co efflux regulator RcnB
MGRKEAIRCRTAPTGGNLMTAKFISTVLKAASVVAVPLAMLAVSTPAGAQRQGHRDNSEWHYNNGRFDNWRYNDGHHKKGHHKDKHKNKNYKNGYYRNGQYNNGRYGQYQAPVILQRPVYGDRGVAGRVSGKALPAPQRNNGYPSRGATRYPSAPVIPGFPTPITPNGRTGKALPGTGQQNHEYNTHRRY